MPVSYSDFGIERQTASISDRIKLTHLKRPNSVFSIYITFKAGALYQPKPGLAHFVEHMLVKESKQYPSLEAIKKTLSQTAAWTNAFTSPDKLSLAANVHEPADGGRILDMLVDQINSPLMKIDRIEKERGAIQQELRMNEKNINSVNYRNLLCLMMNQKGDFVYPVSGSVEQVGKINRQDLLDYYDKLRCQKIYITSTGSMDIAEIRDYFENNLQLGDLHELKSHVISRPQAQAVVVKQKDKNDNIVIRFGQRIKRENHLEDQARLRLTIEYLFGQKGHIYDKLRNEKGLVYGVGGVDYIAADFGAAVFWTECSKDNLDEVVKTMTQEFKGLQKGQLDVDKISEIKQMMVKRLKSRFEKSLDVTQSFIDSTLGGALDPVELVNAIQKVSVAEITQVAKKYFQMSDMLWSLTGELDEQDLRRLGVKGEVAIT